MSTAANVSSRFAQLGVGLSVAVHVGAFVMLTLVPKMPAPAPLPSVVEFEVSKPPEPPPPEPKTEPPPPSEDPLPIEPAALQAEPTPKQAAPPPDAPTPEPAPEQAPVADLTGLTLTNDNGTGSWGSRVGNGSAIERPIRAGSNGRRPAPQAPSAPAAAAPARSSGIVALADLSSRPVPPKLDGILERHYPEVARQQGKSGTAIVRARIDADGRVRKANVVSESETGFGRACHATVMGSQWSAPKDHSGQAVATFVSYTCRFRSNQ
ncbi:MAG TPA: TonB family protein [Polyangiaceae bacterium]